MKKIMVAGLELEKGEYDNYVIGVNRLGAGEAEAFLSIKPEDLAAADGLILPGSTQDINPGLWGEENICSNDVNDELDRLQRELLMQAIADKKPVLGICRGMQFINVYFGGTLIQDLASGSAHRSVKPERYHLVKNAPGSFMAQLFGPETEVNSLHHQGAGRIGDGLKVISWWEGPEKAPQTDPQADRATRAACDACGRNPENGPAEAAPWEETVTEAIIHENLPIIGFQWHPEKMYLYGNEKQQADGAAVLQYFLDMI